MKLLLLVAMSLLASRSFCQLTSEQLKKIMEKSNDQKVEQGRAESVLNFFKQHQPPLLHSQTKKSPGLIYLADGMPCILPGAVAVGKLPNAWTKVQIPYVSPLHPIPNPALPERLQAGQTK